MQYSDPRPLLAIESSCDETAVSIVQGSFSASSHLHGSRCAGIPETVTILSHEVVSQHALHAPFGGVVPEVAARDHLCRLDGIVRSALNNAGVPPQELGGVAVTTGPGLVGALMVGVLFARGFALSLGVPLFAINHVDAHLAPALMLREFSLSCLKRVIPVELPSFPALALTVSGGHCHLLKVNSLQERQLLGKSLDDACGEAFDKVAKLLGMGYPGGARVEEMAARVGEPNWNKGTFKEPLLPCGLRETSQRYNFSYSGLKTAVMDVIRKETGVFKGKISGADLPIETKATIAKAFQEAALKQLQQRVENALVDFPEVQSILVAGGVACNRMFRQMFASLERPVFFAPPALCSDNATMIALQSFLGCVGDGFSVHPFARYQPRDY